MNRPDDIDFELVRTGEADPETEARVRAWPGHEAEIARLEALAEAGRQAYPEADREVSPEVDAALRAAMGAAARRGRRTRRLRRLLTAGAPVAAAAGRRVAVVIQESRRAPEGTPPASQPAARGDLEGDGRFDILDAYLLSRALRTGTVRPEWDVTGDARVDATDVDALARGAVALGAGVQAEVLNRIYPVNQIEVGPRTVAVLGMREQVINADRLGESMVQTFRALPDVIDPALRPSADYLEAVVRGARAHGLPAEALAAIEAAAGSCGDP